MYAKQYILIFLVTSVKVLQTKGYTVFILIVNNIYLSIWAKYTQTIYFNYTINPFESIANKGLYNINF